MFRKGLVQADVGGMEQPFSFNWVVVWLAVIMFFKSANWELMAAM
jgi:hypothetical protein